jgi:predicted GNAT family acetyltransferase
MHEIVVLDKRFDTIWTNERIEMQIRTTNNDELSRFEVYADGQLAGHASYRIRNGRMSMLRTWTHPEFQRRGLASAVVRAALEWARSRNLEVMPYCGFVSWYIAQNDQYLDLVPEGQRQRFNLPPSHDSGLISSGTITS